MDSQVFFTGRASILVDDTNAPIPCNSLIENKSQNASKLKQTCTTPQHIEPLLSPLLLRLVTNPSRYASQPICNVCPDRINPSPRSEQAWALRSHLLYSEELDRSAVPYAHDSLRRLNFRGED